MNLLLHEKKKKIRFNFLKQANATQVVQNYHRYEGTTFYVFFKTDFLYTNR
jgi:hypothetical protein